MRNILICNVLMVLLWGCPGTWDYVGAEVKVENESDDTIWVVMTKNRTTPDTTTWFSRNHDIARVTPFDDNSVIIYNTDFKERYPYTFWIFKEHRQEGSRFGPLLDKKEYSWNELNSMHWRLTYSANSINDAITE